MCLLFTDIISLLLVCYYMATTTVLNIYTLTITHRCTGLADSDHQDVLCRIESVVSSVMQHEKER